MKEKIVLNSYALKLRKELGEDDASPVDVFSLVCGIPNLTVVKYPMTDRVSGLCIKVDKDDSLIAINSTLTNGRQRFTLSHELYHLRFQEGFKSVVCGKEIGSMRDEEERNADNFASFFLAPYDALKWFIEKELEDGVCSVKDIVRIEQHFQMSRQATLNRLMWEGFIKPEFAEPLKNHVRLSALNLGYSEDLYIPSTPEKQYLTTGKYIELVSTLMEKGIITEGKRAELLLDAYRSDIVFSNGNNGEIYD